MAVVDTIKKLLSRLWTQEDYWRIIFAKHGWNITIAEINALSNQNFITRLLQDTLQIDRSSKGFEDFSASGNRLIEPGSPPNSLLFHAFVSPNVYLNENSNQMMRAFPTLFEIDALENFIYSLKPLNLEDLIAQEGEQNVALGVFSYEYRQAINTTHKQHADFCFSRTGVARVGSEHHRYEPNLRAFTIFPDTPQSTGIRTSPARYAAFIAVKRNIQDGDLNVLPFLGNDRHVADEEANRDFWVPIHKLFSGNECLANNQEITLSFEQYHENIKLRKVCEFLNQTRNRDLQRSPYTITEGLIEFMFPSDDDELRSASVWLIPRPHPLVEEAFDSNGERITIRVPPDDGNRYFAALTLHNANGARPAPEYINVRRKVTNTGEVQDLNEEPNVSELVAKGNYNALMYIDYTCDGWIVPICNALNVNILPAYSIVTAPDFIPFAEQRELIEWSESITTHDSYWALKPWALSDTRMLPNITLKNSPFSTQQNDTTRETLTAIVGSLGKPAEPIGQEINPDTRRSSFLPDAAAGEFQPGWDISWDLDEDNRTHLAAYGLGSPFLEDAKLCAALSTFWPAAAPDIARSYVMEGEWPSIAPLLDDEIGQTNQPAWDGVPGPKRIERDGEDWVEFPDFNHIDYVTQGLQNKFTVSKIGEINIEEYKDRIDSLWHLYKTLKALQSKGKWRVLSFKKVQKTDFIIQDDLGAVTAEEMQESIYAATLYRIGAHQPSADNKKVFEKINSENKFYIDNSNPRKIWRKKGNEAWKRV